MHSKSPKRRLTINHHHQSLEKVTHNLDLLNEILIRLSSKSSIRCMLVCKSWYALIKKIHFHKQEKSPQLFGLFCHIPSVPISQYHYIPLADGEADSQYKINPFGFLDFEYSKIIQSCNGVLLIFNSFPLHQYYVYNTVTRQHSVLPRFSCDNFISSMSLVCDPERKSHHKVVAFRRLRQGFSQILVYSSDSCVWRVASDAIEVEPDVSFLRGSIVWENSVIWVNCNTDMPSLRFKLDTEELMTFLLPPIQEYYDEDCIYIDESDGHLYFVFGCYDSVNKFNVYELERHSLQWLLRWQVDLSDVCLAFHQDLNCSEFPGLISFIPGNGEEECFLVLYMAGHIVLYNLTDGMYRKLCYLNMDIDRMQYFQRWGHKSIFYHKMPVHYL